MARKWEILSLCISPEQGEEVREAAALDERSVSAFVRRALRSHCDQIVGEDEHRREIEREDRSND